MQFKICVPNFDEVTFKTRQFMVIFHEDGLNRVSYANQIFDVEEQHFKGLFRFCGDDL
jgi:hypothetical protein